MEGLIIYNMAALYIDGPQGRMGYTRQAGFISRGQLEISSRAGGARQAIGKKENHETNFSHHLSIPHLTVEQTDAVFQERQSGVQMASPSHYRRNVRRST